MSTTDTRAAMHTQLDATYPLTDNPHTSVQQRQVECRTAFIQGWTQCQAEATKATGTAGELPPLPDFSVYRDDFRKELEHHCKEYGQTCFEAARTKNPRFSAEDIEAMIQGRAAEIAAARQPAPDRQVIEGEFAIQVEKMLCKALGREWSATGISIESLIAALAAPAAQPYRHIKSGKLYELLHIGALEADLTVSAIYRCTQTGQVWVRPMTEFTEKFELAATNRSQP